MTSRPAALLLGVTVLGMLPAAVTAQTLPPKPAATAPRTPDGKPDLQGFWDFRTLTPLERPAALKDKTTLTEAERVELDRQLDRALNAPPPPGSTGAYAAYWFEWGRQSSATSVIVGRSLTAVTVSTKVSVAVPVSASVTVRLRASAAPGIARIAATARTPQDHLIALRPIIEDTGFPNSRPLGRPSRSTGAGCGSSWSA